MKIKISIWDRIVAFWRGNPPHDPDGVLERARHAKGGMDLK